MNLTRAGIVAAAMGILDSYGLGDLTMRRLAAVLDVQPGALYYHFANKQELLAAMAEVVLAGLPRLAPGDPAGGLRVWGARLHDLLRRHRGGAELVSAVLALRPWEEGPGAAVAADLVTAGLGPDEARAAATGVLYLVLGYAFDEDQRAQAQALGVAAGPGPDSAVILDQAVALVTAGLRVTAPPD